MAGLPDQDAAALSALVTDLMDHPQAVVVYQLEGREELEDFGCVFEVAGSDGGVLGIRIAAADGSVVGRCTQVFGRFGVTLVVLS